MYLWNPNLLTLTLVPLTWVLTYFGGSAVAGVKDALFRLTAFSATPAIIPTTATVSHPALTDDYHPKDMHDTYDDATLRIPYGPHLQDSENATLFAEAAVGRTIWACTPTGPPHQQSTRTSLEFDPWTCVEMRWEGGSLSGTVPRMQRLECRSATSVEHVAYWSGYDVWLGGATMRLRASFSGIHIVGFLLVGIILLAVLLRRIAHLLKLQAERVDGGNDKASRMPRLVLSVNLEKTSAKRRTTPRRQDSTILTRPFDASVNSHHILPTLSVPTPALVAAEPSEEQDTIIDSFVSQAAAGYSSAEETVVEFAEERLDAVKETTDSVSQSFLSAAVELSSLESANGAQAWSIQSQNATLYEIAEIKLQSPPSLKTPTDGVADSASDAPASSSDVQPASPKAIPVDEGKKWIAKSPVSPVEAEVIEKFTSTLPFSSLEESAFAVPSDTGVTTVALKSGANDKGLTAIPTCVDEMNTVEVSGPNTDLHHESTTSKMLEIDLVKPTSSKLNPAAAAFMPNAHLLSSSVVASSSAQPAMLEQWSLADGTDDEAAMDYEEYAESISGSEPYYGSDFDADADEFFEGPMEADLLSHNILDTPAVSFAASSAGEVSSHSVDDLGSMVNIAISTITAMELPVDIGVAALPCEEAQSRSATRPVDQVPSDNPASVSTSQNATEASNAEPIIEPVAPTSQAGGSSDIVLVEQVIQPAIQPSFAPDVPEELRTQYLDIHDEYMSKWGEDGDARVEIDYEYEADRHWSRGTGVALPLPCGVIVHRLAVKHWRDCRNADDITWDGDARYEKKKGELQVALKTARGGRRGRGRGGRARY